MGKEKSTLSAARLETRLQKSMRGAPRWVPVALMAFGLGALVIAFALYIPTWLNFDQANAGLVLHNATFTGKIEQNTTLQTGNETWKKKLDFTMQHLYVLALSSVREARLAVAADDYASARRSLIRASEALDALSGLLGTDQKDILTATYQSTTQALTEVNTDFKSAQPVLDQLTNNLIQLEDNLFPNP